jgi:hypothetical protein
MALFKPKQRNRFGQLPVPSECANLYWSKKQPELAGITNGQLTLLIIETPEFKEVITPMLNAIDDRNRTIGKGKTMGRPSRFTSLHLESVLIYRRIAGLETVKETRERMHCDQEAQELLDLTKGLPSLKTMSRYMRERLEVDLRADLYMEFDRKLRQRVLQLPGMDEETRIMGMDGSRQGTRYMPPIPTAQKQQRKERKEGKTPRANINSEIAAGKLRAITAPTAGFVGKEGGPKAGQGWQLLGLWSEHGTLLAWDISALNLNEKPAAERVLASYQQEVLPHRDPHTISVLTADGGFHSNKIRALSQQLRIVPNIHKASHKKDFTQPGEETSNAAKLNKHWLPFKDRAKPHYSNWLANGHCELACKCGAGKTKRADHIGKTDLSIALKGCCQKCGSITITVGQWRLAEDGVAWVRCHRNDKPDLALGNSLTFNNQTSREYGQDRFGFGESVHATLKHRFGLLQEKSWQRDITEVRTEFAIAAIAISVLLLEREARKAQLTNLISLSTSSSQAEALPLAA